MKGRKPRICGGGCGLDPVVFISEALRWEERGMQFAWRNAYRVNIQVCGPHAHTHPQTPVWVSDSIVTKEVCQSTKMTPALAWEFSQRHGILRQMWCLFLPFWPEVQACLSPEAQPVSLGPVSICPECLFCFPQPQPPWPAEQRGSARHSLQEASTDPQLLSGFTYVCGKTGLFPMSSCLF